MTSDLRTLRAISESTFRRRPGGARRPRSRSTVSLAGGLAVAAACLMLTGCGSTSGSAKSFPLGLNLGKDRLTEAVQNDPFPEAREVNLEI